jgi:hypothetical protein
MMDSLRKDLVYEEKIDNISEYLEELIFDAMLSALRKMKEKNMLFDDLLKKNKTDDISF